MKKKLLITMGCSHTEGLGCWNMHMNYPDGFDSTHRDYGNFMHINLERFHSNGWPMRLGKKLGYDKVINLGLAGSSTSSQMKWFVLKYTNKNYKNYDVTVVWLLTESNRTSFYKDTSCHSLLSSGTRESGSLELFNTIYKFVSNNGERDTFKTQKDYIREEYVNRKVVKSISEFKNWNFISFHCKVHEYGELIKQIYNDEKTHCFEDIGFEHENNQNLISKFCKHFNEDGYEMIANRMFDWIFKNHPNLTETPKDDIICKWENASEFNNKF